MRVGVSQLPVSWRQTLVQSAAEWAPLPGPFCDLWGTGISLQLYECMLFRQFRTEFKQTYLPPVVSCVVAVYILLFMIIQPSYHCTAWWVSLPRQLL